MERAAVILKVSEPTQWCACMVIVPKSSGSLQICVDLKPLNESVLREMYTIPDVNHVLAHLAGAQKFSKLDANSGLWQIPLATECYAFTTFPTPFGCYCFNQLPIRISSAPELLRKRMAKILEVWKGFPATLMTSWHSVQIKRSMTDFWWQSWNGWKQ